MRKRQTRASQRSGAGAARKLQYLRAHSNLPETLRSSPDLAVLRLSGGAVTHVSVRAVTAAAGMLCVLDLADSLVSSLPPELSKLQALQHLNLSGCTSLRVLPPEWRQLSSLRRLNLCGCSSLADVPKAWLSCRLCGT